MAVAITKIQEIMIKRMNHVSDKIIEYQREVINSLLTFDILQAHLTPAHIQNCCFEDFEYVYKQALSIKEVRWLFSEKWAILKYLNNWFLDKSKIKIHQKRIEC